jgi:uncharacterized protein YndB with AHSA1/START domain
MAVHSIRRDNEALTLTVVSEFDASVDRIWRVWEDPRLLERWWGPPTWPATFERYEFRPGGECRYHMTGPEGEKSRGWWTITAVEPPHRLEFDDGFAGEDGEPSGALGVTHGVVTIEADGAKTRMTVVSRFTDLEQLEKMAAMGMEDGLRLAFGQIDDLLAEGSRG